MGSDVDLDRWQQQPTHGRQALSGYHGYYQQHQYFPLLIFDGQSRFPLAAWLRPGTHVDLVGGFTPKMREADDEAVRRARIYVDTRAGALKEAGDLVIPLRRKVIAKADIRGDLFEMA